MRTGAWFAGAARSCFCLIVWLWLATGIALAATSFPALTGRVVDQAGVLSPQTQSELTALSEALEKKTGSQLVVATVKSLGGDTIEEYGYQLGRAWGVGQKGKDNGTLLIVAPQERKVRIEAGYGLEDRLTDAATRGIIERSILPRFRNGDFDTGVRDGANAIARLVAGEVLSPEVPEATDTPQGQGVPIEFILIVLFFLFVGGRGFLWPLLFLGGRRGYRGGFGGGGFGRSSGGFSGGGGSFGGGGASGSW